MILLIDQSLPFALTTLSAIPCGQVLSIQCCSDLDDRPGTRRFGDARRDADGTVSMGVHDPERKWTGLLNEEAFDRVIILMIMQERPDRLVPSASEDLVWKNLRSFSVSLLENARITFANLLISTHGLAIMTLEVTNTYAYSMTHL
jgi:hypothetical protein